MKTLKLLSLLIISFFISQFTYSQSQSERKEITANYDLEKLTRLSKKFFKIYNIEKQKAIKYALENNIDLIIEKDNGGISILEKVLDDGTLIYVSTDNDGSATTLNTDLLYNGGGKNLSLSGTGIMLGIWDGGRVRNSHQELIGRVTQIDNPTNFSSHATHVSGTMIASGVNPNAKGMAFNANLSAHDFGNDLSEMAFESSNGLLLSNHSYGISANSTPISRFGAYLDISADLDLITFNAPYYLPVFSAGNSNNASPPFNPSKNGYDLIIGRKVAKNVLTVANVLEVTNYVDASSVNISSSSSWGPVDDSRVKPDISAKGTNVLSSTATGDNSYAFFTGTSMAAPSVSGSLGLLHQHYNNLKGGFLTAASMKALVIHTAREAGNSPGPDYKFGWGLMDTAAAADVLTRQNFTDLLEENTLDDGETYSFTVDAIDSTSPLVATIVWTDAPGTIQSSGAIDDPTPRLVNDLDLRIIGPDGSTVYFPWTLSAASPAAPAIKADNIVDNVEKVEVENAVGQYTIEVSHKGSLQGLSQNYTLIVSGFGSSDFAIVSGDPIKSYCSDEQANFIINTISTDNFSENLSLTQSGLPASLGTLFFPATISSNGDSSIFSVNNLSSVPAGDYPFTVTASFGSESFDLDFVLTVISDDGYDNININSPANGEEAILSPTLTWDALSDVNFYEVEVSETSNFDSVFFSLQTSSTEIEIPELTPNQTYYWRVRAINDCITGAFNNENFTTKTIECDPIAYSNDTPILIDDVNVNTVQSVLNISGFSSDIKIDDLNIDLEISHTYLSDLVISLTSPEGTTITLLNGPCGNLNDMNVTLDDKGQAINCNPASPPALSGIILTEDRLSAFIGEALNGDWTLTVEDVFSQDGGTIDRFGIEFCYEETLSISTNTIADFNIFPNPSSGKVTLNFKNNLTDSSNVIIYDINGRRLKSFTFDTVQNNKLLDLNDLNSGIYLIELESGEFKSTKKLIIN